MNSRKLNKDINNWLCAPLDNFTPIQSTLFQGKNILALLVKVVVILFNTMECWDNTRLSIHAQIRSVWKTAKLESIKCWDNTRLLVYIIHYIIHYTRPNRHPGKNIILTYPCNNVLKWKQKMTFLVYLKLFEEYDDMLFRKRSWSQGC